jgi:hypothetical protein
MPHPNAWRRWMGRRHSMGLPAIAALARVDRAHQALKCRGRLLDLGHVVRHSRRGFSTTHTKLRGRVARFVLARPISLRVMHNARQQVRALSPQCLCYAWPGRTSLFGEYALGTLQGHHWS